MASYTNPASNPPIALSSGRPSMRYCWAALLVAPLLGTSFAQGQTAKLALKLGPNEAAWQVAAYQGGKIDAVAIDGDGRPASSIGPNGLVLTTAAAIAPDTELFVRFRITLPKGQGRGLPADAGQT